MKEKTTGSYQDRKLENFPDRKDSKVASKAFYPSFAIFPPSPK